MFLLVLEDKYKLFIGNDFIYVDKIIFFLIILFLFRISKNECILCEIFFFF